MSSRIPNESTRACRRCSRELPVSEFHRWYDIKRLQNELMEWYINLKSGPCTDCGHCFHHSAMQYDHLPGRPKAAEVSKLIKGGSRRRVLQEIAKCELVCANCHAIRSHKRRAAA